VEAVQMIKAVAMLLLTGTLAGGSAANVTLKGVVRDCEGANEVRVSGVSVVAFDRLRSAEVVRLAQSLDTTVLIVTDTAAVKRFNTIHSRMISLVMGPGAVARGKSDAGGDLTLSVPRQDSLFVFAYRALDDEPNYYAYGMVSAKARGSFFLDMSRGACQYQS
jgi:hypothetical protein